MPAKAGIHNYLKTLDSRLRGNDVKGRFKTFYESINIGIWDLFVIWCLSFGIYTTLFRKRQNGSFNPSFVNYK